MRKLFIAFATATALLTSACTGTTVTPEAVVAEIQKNCGIVVVVADIASLISGGNPIALTVQGVAHAVCAAFQQQASGSAKAEATEGTLLVNGVTVHYHR